MAARIINDSCARIGLTRPVDFVILKNKIILSFPWKEHRSAGKLSLRDSIRYNSRFESCVSERMDIGTIYSNERGEKRGEKNEITKGFANVERIIRIDLTAVGIESRKIRSRVSSPLVFIYYWTTSRANGNRPILVGKHVRR